MSLRHHQSRERVLAELHARPFVPLPTGTRLLHFAFQTTRDGAERDREAMVRLAAVEGRDTAGLNERYLILNGDRLRWERHGEFVSYTFVVAPDESATWPGGYTPPGELLVAVDLRLTGNELAPSRLVEAAIVDGDGRLTSDFLPNAAGFVEIVVANKKMSDETAGATVQRILELETYRCFALLGLPVAEAAASAIGRIEAELPLVMERMDAAYSLEDNRELLDRLTALTVDLERNSAATHFRFGATRSYAEIVHLRLETLAELRDSGQAGLAAFFLRRFDPAIRFCSTISDREANLARKLTRAAQLLRTRVEIALQSQNRDLLAGMGDRLRLQLRLQRTVEGLSVVAVSYYAAGLLHYLLDGAGRRWSSIDAPLVVGGAVPLIIISVASVLIWVKHRHSDETAADPSSETPCKVASSLMPEMD
ncbi:MAG TPA: DUF3422 domain-containing protein [Sphingomicrobium sp.]|nr:DUF3422 domain-containing protein [Sphingomicrobium sp.]